MELSDGSGRRQVVLLRASYGTSTSQNVSLDLYRRSRARDQSILLSVEDCLAERSSLKDCVAYIALFIVCVWDFIISGEAEDLLGVLDVTG